ncbi:FtsX-like permease family protein [Williamwhitmania taraxaci]|uniref:Lipoprotein-releasing system permease protein n=1 Tax=Williamwhitmania taraxaci TaxID=1640674 RepID=A0A1G6PEN1_9BACT|nr:FtsX-like permease family protein [Williamwhitmania taraxaci]SDC78700.1 lipoprotein-releasing system permease protein [Williamwhitmania taraxaci]
MNFPLFVARRYLFSKKSHNAINWVTAISAIGVSVGAMALVVVLSVSNGFNGVVESLFNSFDPDLKVVLVEGKSFSANTPNIKGLKNIPGIADYAEVVEENALFKYSDRQHVGIMKGVGLNYSGMSGIDTMLVEGVFKLKHGDINLALVGEGVAYKLGVGINFSDPIFIYLPKRGQGYTLNPAEEFNKGYVYPSAIFSIPPEFDAKYILVPIALARKLLDYTDQVTSLEIKLKKGADPENAQEEVGKLLGANYKVLTRYQQNEVLYRIMKSEKVVAFFILAFILLVASFNVIMSLSLLVIEKKHDAAILSGLGATPKTIERIFLLEGWLISTIGATIGILLGLGICLAQQHFKLLRLSGSGSFVIDAYPVTIIWSDIAIVFITVLIIGFAAAKIPILFSRKKLLSDESVQNELH